MVATAERSEFYTAFKFRSLGPSLAYNPYQNKSAQALARYCPNIGHLPSASLPPTARERPV